MDNQYYSILDKLDRIEQRLGSKQTNKYLSIIQVADLTSLSTSTIRRAVARGHLKCSRRLGKLLFLESDVRKWIDG